MLAFRNLRSFTKSTSLKVPISKIIKYNLCTAASNPNPNENASSSSSTTNDNHTDAKKEETPKDIREKLLSRALEYVHTIGWQDECLARAAVDLGLPSLSHSIARRGAYEMLEFYLEQKRLHVYKLMQDRSKIFENGNYSAEEANELKLRMAIEAHLDYIIPYRKSWAEAVSLTIDPLELPYSFRSFYSVVDDLCYFSDIRTSRLDWYTERMLMGMLYTSTELYMLTDQSENFNETK